MLFRDESIFLLVGIIMLRLFDESSPMLSDDSFQLFVDELVN